MASTEAGARSEDEYLEILQANVGFESPRRWVRYARQHQFRRVPAGKLASCPDCDSPDLSRIGQYVYYSNLCRLLRCHDCHLVFSDTRLDPAVIARHFERAYKDERYFSRRRKAVFDQITELIDGYAGHRSRVLDVGGAKGHLMAALRARRPDLDLTVNDLSGDACDHARRHFGLRAIAGPLSGLRDSGERYDVIALIDVIYYEPDLKALWAVIADLLESGGVLIVRIPNRAWLMRTAERVKDLFLTARRRSLSTRIGFFNPEQLYVFSRRYLRRRFASLERADCRFLPARSTSAAGSPDVPGRLFHAFASLVASLSRSRILLSPSQIVIVKLAAGTR